MIRQVLKSIVRRMIGLTNGDSVPVLAGPLKGRRLLRQHGLPNLSMLFGTYEADFAAVFAARSQGCRVVYDVGAHAGYFALLAAGHLSSGGVVQAFEPVPENARDCREVVGLNQLSDCIRVEQVAMSDSVGTAQLVTPASSTSGILSSAVRHTEIDQNTAIEVPTSTLDRFILDEGNPRPDVIKIDVEGAEALVLRGAARTLDTVRPTVLIEVHGRQPAADIWDIASQHAYDVALLEGRQETDVNDRSAWLKEFTSSKWTIRHCVLIPRQSAAAAA